MIQANSLLLNFQMKSPCYLVTLSLESSDFQTFLKQYVILVPFGALIQSRRGGVQLRELPSSISDGLAHFLILQTLRNTAYSILNPVPAF